MRRYLPLLLLFCLLLSGCTARDPIAPTADVNALPAPGPDDTAVSPHREEATLWFRLGEEALLAPETRELSVSPTASYELALLQALTDGPAAASTELTDLFPPGTRVNAVHRQGRTLFVTLSKQIMNAFADEPSVWESDPAWAEEVPLRRLLAMQAIAATVTENCDVDQVIILVEQSSANPDSLRLRQSYYRIGGDDNALAEPLTRDESLLLTPYNTARVVLDCWQTRNWARLYTFVARTGTDGQARPAYDDFAAQMDALPHLTGYSLSTGNVSLDGQRAAFTVTATILDGTQTAQRTWTLHLTRERGLWRIVLSQLTEREVQP